MAVTKNAAGGKGPWGGQAGGGGKREGMVGGSRPNSPDGRKCAIPEDDDLLHNIVGEIAMLFALLAYFLRVAGHSFPSGKLLGGAQEPLEVHQIFPRATLDRYPERDNEYVPQRLGNLTLLVRSDNEHIGDTAPDVYLRIIDPADRAAHLIPDDSSLWSVRQYNAFCEERERALCAMLRDLLYSYKVT